MKKNRRKRQNGILVIMLAVLALFSVLFYRSISLEKKKAELQAVVAEKEAHLAEEQERTQELTAKKSYMSTINYIEDLAREKLGLVFKNEVIFREKDDDSE
ncbi:MAG: septum formation initiator family protein [Lachnospiraceae bacterium]|nr:septum formation initiator family protein [Lachnospiraceae bacterium]